ncbi:MAG: DUF3135 domain-containing protein [Burkholderiales bacterium]
MDFNFDEWSKLAHQDREEFERRRAALIEDLIRTAPPEYRRRLRGLQFQVDMERRRSSTPLGACVRISAMMWDRFADLRMVLNGMASGKLEAPITEPGSRSAVVLQFPNAN